MEMLTPESKYPFLVFDDVIPEDMMENVWKEIDYLKTFVNADVEETGTARDPITKIAKKQNSGVWLNDFYYNNNYSPILKSLRVLSNPSLLETVSNYDNAFLGFPYAVTRNVGGVLLSTYKDGDYYQSHEDNAYFTLVLWLYKEPKNFTGGNLTFNFNEMTEELEIKNNRAVLFPSFYSHSVEQVNYHEENTENLRHAISVFITPYGES